MEFVIRLKDTKQPIMLGKSLQHCKDRLRPMFLKHIEDMKYTNSFELEVAEITEVELKIWAKQYEIIRVFIAEDILNNKIENLDGFLITEEEKQELNEMLFENNIANLN